MQPAWLVQTYHALRSVATAIIGQQLTRVLRNVEAAHEWTCVGAPLELLDFCFVRLHHSYSVLLLCCSSKHEHDQCSLMSFPATQVVNSTYAHYGLDCRPTRGRAVPGRAVRGRPYHTHTHTHRTSIAVFPGTSCA